jgi:hypothetical protein
MKQSHPTRKNYIVAALSIEMESKDHVDRGYGKYYGALALEGCISLHADSADKINSANAPSTTYHLHICLFYIALFRKLVLIHTMSSVLGPAANAYITSSSYKCASLVYQSLRTRFGWPRAFSV